MDSVVPKKSLGQHWLHDRAVLADICDDAAVQRGDHVLEVGPGLGTLTSMLLERGAQVVAVEFDAALADGLAARMRSEARLLSDALANLTVVQQDILRFDLGQMPDGYKVVANIPYYLTGNLVRALCESSSPFSTAALLVQKEVAERICASPGQMSLLAVSAQYYCEVSLGTYVPREFFVPPPKVDSQVVVLRRRVDTPCADVDKSQFFRVVRAGFSQKRKTLLNSLSAGLRLPKSEVHEALLHAGLMDNVRAQALSLNEWSALTLHLKSSVAK